MSSIRRPWFATFVAASTCAGLAFGQSESTDSGASAPTAPSGSSTPTAPGDVSISDPPASSSFRIFGSNEPAGRSNVADSPPSFVVPGFYGQGSQSVFGGVGRLARPRFESTASFSFGYDDNVFQTPSDVPRILLGGSTVVEEQPVEVVVDPGSPGGEPIFENRPIFTEGGIVQLRPVLVGFTGPTDPVTDVLEVPDAERKGSFFSRASFGFQMQQYTRRSLLTMDFNAGRTYYWDKEEDPNDYNGGLSVTFLHRFTPRLQVTALVGASYLSQPDLSIPNTPERQIVGDLIYVNSRADVSYRITPRFSMSLSAGFTGQSYTEKAEQGRNSSTYTFGVEAKYLSGPRWTFLTEFRQSMVEYPDLEILNSTTWYALVGSEFVINPRLSGSLRVGASLKEFESTGDSQISPYLESTVGYRSTSRSSVNWINRLGFEEPGSPDDERLVYRTTLQYVHAFTPRLRGNAALTIIHEVTTNDVTQTEFAQDTLDASLGLDYQLSRNFALSASYTFTLTNSNTRLSDYYRNRLTFGGQYTF